MAPRRRRDKRPALPRDVRTQKIPSYLRAPNLEGRHLAWRFSSADLDGPFSCGDLSHLAFKALWERLRAFERMNIAQLRDAGSLHSPRTVELAKAAKRRLQQIKLDDVDVLYSFHITGACRLWCMKHENLMSILWWDEHHEVYPTPKRHT